MAKPRKKKPANGMVAIKTKEINSIVNIAYQGIGFLGDCYHTPRAMNIQKLYTHLRGHSHEIGMREFLRVLYHKKKWSLGVMCVFKDKENEDIFEVSSAAAIIEESTADEMSACLSDVILETIKAIQDHDKTLTNDRFCYYSYFLEPEVSNILHVKLIGLMDLFMNLDDLSVYEPFGDELPGFESTVDTIPLAIKNNGIWPKIKEVCYVATDAEEIEALLIN